MPGILIHEAIAEMVLRADKNNIIRDKVLFLSGNQIPDLAVANKQITHARFISDNSLFEDSDIGLIRVRLLDINNPVKLGMYCHLYSDKLFVKWHLSDIYRPTADGCVINTQTLKKWKTEDFFSNNGLYGAYTALNKRIIKERLVSKKLMQSIPDNLPLTGMELYDIRVLKTWREELNEYIEETKTRVVTNKVFSWKGVVTSMHKIAESYIQELEHIINMGQWQ